MKSEILRTIFDKDRLIEAWTSLGRNRRRSLLTAFGIFWGVFMLVVMLSTGKGIQGGIFGGIEKIPRNLTLCFTNKTSIPYQGFRKGRWWEMKTGDMDAIAREMPEARIISPMVWGRSVRVVNGTKNGSYQLKGVSWDYTDIMPIVIKAGRSINRLDVEQCRKVTVLGQKIVNEIFYGKAPLGEYVQIGGVSYQVIGVAEQASDNFNLGGREDEAICMPYNLVQRLYNMGDEIGMMMICADDSVPIESVEQRAGSIIRSRHQIAPDDIRALDFMNMASVLDIFRMLALGIDTLIWIVGLGTLLSGAVGVSNIVMITVRERTSEIGVRRAIGAKPSGIVAQIMTESLIITALAGVAGLVAGVLAMIGISEIGTLGIGDNAIKLVNPMISFRVAVAALVVIGVTGLAAGLLPARKALKIKAIDAIREE